MLAVMQLQLVLAKLQTIEQYFQPAIALQHANGLYLLVVQPELEIVHLIFCELNITFDCQQHFAAGHLICSTGQHTELKVRPSGAVRVGAIAVAKAAAQRQTQ